MNIQPFTTVVDWPEILCLMEVYTYTMLLADTVFLLSMAEYESRFNSYKILYCGYMICFLKTLKHICILKTLGECDVDVEWIRMLECFESQIHKTYLNNHNCNCSL